MFGFCKAAWMLLAMLFLLPVWFVRGAVTRARFRAELAAAGVPPAAVRKLSDRYKIRLSDLSRLKPLANR